MVEKICDEDAQTNFEYLACGPDPNFPSDDECSSDDKTEDLFNEDSI